ncbi:DUF2125 domain-containing protein [Hyphomonas johnsonii]|jgi:hypothetical protein|uniref:DUF2125 domain-containing protein n=1 Tax=Hyphomonas johnsonii MHS-2 TaxID=1280950 RepID=A0A059FLW1_9PROT|nr:DUF2125 domain-containing protein [Hyphomonas johnsonii]KCZ91634.1 hypothetical protein HJO_10972 [Hyphomonas johnsonii MHS-2]
MSNYWNDPGLVEPLAKRRRSRFWLYFPFVLFILGVLVYSAYWIYARAEIERGVDEWVAAERADGAIVDFSSREIGGYPFRFELEVTDPVYQPARMAKWEGETLQVVMQPWNWHHIIGRAPGHSVVTDRLGIRHSFDIDRKSAGSLSWTADGIRRAAIDLHDVSALIDGQAYTTKGFSLNLAPGKDAPDDLLVALQWDALTLDAAPAEAPWLGTDLQASRLIVEIHNFYPAWVRSGGDPERLYEAFMDTGGGIDLGQALLGWGPLKFGAKGNLTAENGKVNGSFGVRIDDPEDLKAALKSAGRWRLQEQATVATLETASKDGGFLTFTVKDNKVMIGTVMVAALPGTGL